MRDLVVSSLRLSCLGCLEVPGTPTAWAPAVCSWKSQRSFAENRIIHQKDRMTGQFSSCAIPKRACTALRPGGTGLYYRTKSVAGRAAQGAKGDTALVSRKLEQVFDRLIISSICVSGVWPKRSGFLFNDCRSHATSRSGKVMEVEATLERGQGSSREGLLSTKFARAGMLCRPERNLYAK